ncbi:MAG: hypothetical protein P4L56_15425 [Candidatus Sulfopaludibacter sp.]|nr:hypothetical protein [Candidatus Sulfopaludibacter sp.]
MINRVLGAAAILAALSMFALQPAQPPSVEVHSAAKFDISPPLSSLRETGAARESASCRNCDAPGDPDQATQRNDAPPPAPPPLPAAAIAVEQKEQGTRPAAKPIAAFDGMGAGFEGPQGPAAGRNPSDNSLAAGPDRIVQIVNSRLAVFDKQGKVLYGAVATNTIFKGFGGTCEARNNGDAVVRYDQLAGRWLYVMPIFTRIQERPEEPYSVCYALSTGPDPLGPYYRYEFRRKLFPDYPRPAVWPDGYYLPTSTGDEVIQKHACVADRAKMLTGKAATEQCVILDNVNFLNNADVDGQAVPPAGAPNIMMAAGGTQLKNVFGDDGIYYWTFHVDWTNPKNTKVSEAVKISVAPYHYLCNGQLSNCVPQPDTTRRLDAQGDKIMQRLVYRNIGGRESIVAIHSVNSSTGAGGVRWYEFRLDEKREPRLFQQGTYAPDGFYRWMGSAGMDKQGNIGIGYSFGGTPHFAGQRFAARMAEDPPGALGFHETVLAEGEASQTSGNRWEDYTTTAMDPSDDCTFWYVGDYLKKGAATYSTRIGAFRLPGCLRGTISGVAYMDLNHDGTRQKDEPAIPGREIAYSGAESGKVTTGADGAFRISLPADPVYADPVYTIQSKTIHLKAGDAIGMDFPDTCTVTSSGARDAKFWMGDKGQNAVDQHYGEWKKLINTLYLTTGEGTRFLPKRYSQFRAWLHKPPSALLAAQAVAGLNAEAGTLDGKGSVQDPVVKDWVTIHNLIKRVSDAWLARNKGALDAYKTLLDQLNNNTATITPSNAAACAGK